MAERQAHIDNQKLQYIARISHGKDSLKMLDVIITRGLPLDRITTTDVWATDTIRGEYPEMVKFKTRVDEYIWRKYKIEVEHLCAMRDGKKLTYESLFYHVPKRKSGGGASSDSQPYGGHGANPLSSEMSEPQINGFPFLIGSWCKKLKIRFSGCPATRGGKNIVEYLGITADEPKRFGQLNERIRAPLVEFGIEEELCGLHCKYEGILVPTYESSFRDGCWMCHNQGVKQLRHLRKNYPELWSILMKWDTDSPVSFKPDGHSVHDYDRRFQLEDEHLLSPDGPFFWKKLEEDLQYSLF